SRKLSGRPPPALPLSTSDELKKTVRTFIWHLDEEQAAIYTEDRRLALRLLELKTFPIQHESQWTTYRRENGRAFAWQAAFSAALWHRVVRLVGRQALTVMDEPPHRRTSEASAASAPGPAGAARSPKRARPSIPTASGPAEARSPAGEVAASGRSSRPVSTTGEKPTPRSSTCREAAPLAAESAAPKRSSRSRPVAETKLATGAPVPQTPVRRREENASGDSTRSRRARATEAVKAKGAGVRGKRPASGG
ncbi:MAG: hypothetical protein HY320_10175, partial [Armatimonadetes bacterium]|nr:hypothetical protein [Armatimonadota bacterium]